MSAHKFLDPEDKLVDVAIIGAGPYGLSLAAHLTARNVGFRIFGRPMQGWTEQMPKGMRLKSDGFASSLSDPGGTFTIADFCKERGLPYQDSGLPVPIETFSSYALEFQKRFVPQVEDKRVMAVRRVNQGFEVELEDGEQVQARRVVVAVGIHHFRQLPPVLSHLPLDMVSHSSDHCDLSRFRGKRVLVVGAGASALDTAAILHQSGATTELVARKSTIRFHDPPGHRSLKQRMRAPKTGLGPGWKVFWCVKIPWAFRALPEDLRLKFVAAVLAPAPGWFIKQEVMGKVPLRVGTTIERAEKVNGAINLDLMENGTPRNLVVDHIIAATGYRVDLSRLSFLDTDMLASIQTSSQFPALSPHFESSVPGLYFVGATAASTFGPLMCFVFGTEFAAQRLSRHLGKSRLQVPVRHDARSGASAPVLGS